MPRKAQVIQASPLVADLIKSELKKRTLSAQYQKRLQVIDLALSGMENKAIAPAVGYSERSVRSWRSRWADHMEQLNRLEQELCEEKGGAKMLLNQIKHLLSDQPRPGSPRRITESERLRIQALACESPAAHGLPFSNWTHVSLSVTLKKMGIEVSRSQVGVILKKRLTSA